MKDAIILKNLRKEFGSNIAVNNISMEIKEGIIFSLLGVNGAGKTTSIRMMTGLSKPTAGDARIFGYSVKEDLAQVKQISNLSPQDTSVAPNLTVRENLEFMAQIYGMNRKKAADKTNEMIEMFSLQNVEKAKAKTLSGGWQRRLSIAMAMITEPRILFLDEPTLGLDVLARQELWKILREIRKTTTIVLTTHYMEEAESLSDEVAVMINGSIKAQGTVTELKQLTGQDSLEKAFIKIAEGGIQE
ncbi:MAG: ABC transporter ATP-binding protein [Lachnospiraceae bacterium]|nr:ABC transporter ATP-binding protein [Lachnospiraceae bacterium]